MLRRGQTILELVIAVGVISISTIAALTLIYSTVTAGRSSRERVEATNFAREGIEIVRAIRDSNWLRIEQNVSKSYVGGAPAIPYTWDLNPNCNILNGLCDQYLGGATPQESVPVMSASGSWALERRGGAANDDQITLRTNTSTGESYYTQKCFATSPYSCTPSRYRRFLRITKRTGTAGDAVDYAVNAATVTERLEYLEVESVVSWPSTGGTRSITVKERLYNWR